MLSLHVHCTCLLDSVHLLIQKLNEVDYRIFVQCPFKDLLFWSFVYNSVWHMQYKWNWPVSEHCTSQPVVWTGLNHVLWPVYHFAHSLLHASESINGVINYYQLINTFIFQYREKLPLQRICYKLPVGYLINQYVTIEERKKERKKERKCRMQIFYSFTRLSRKMIDGWCQIYNHDNNSHFKTSTSIKFGIINIFVNEPMLAKLSVFSDWACCHKGPKLTMVFQLLCLFLSWSRRLPNF